jgi:hypothetical protein
MAVAYDAYSDTGATYIANVSSFTWTHTPTGTPAGILLFCIAGSSGDMFTSATYGGVSMSAVSGGTAVDAAAETAYTETYFLGSGIPSGAQDVVVQRENSSMGCHACAISVTAGGNTAVYTPGIVVLQGDGTLAEQNVDDGSPGTNSLRFAGGMSGRNTASTPGASSTSIIGRVFSARSHAIARETAAGQGSRAVGFADSNTDDRAFVHLAVYEIASAASSYLSLRPGIW